MHSQFKNNNPYLFNNFGCAEASLRHMWAARAVACRLLLLQIMGSRASGLSCPTVCGILVSQLGNKTTSPASLGRFSTTGPLGRSWFVSFEMPIVHRYHGCVSGKNVELTLSSVFLVFSPFIIWLSIYYFSTYSSSVMCHSLEEWVSQHFLGHYHESKEQTWSEENKW